MTAPLLSLPNELKQEVIGHLDTQAILSLRLVNKDLLNNVQETQAFENLFEQVTIHLHPQSLELFKAICASPILSKVVKKVSVSILAFSEPPNPSILTEQDHSIFNELVAMEDHYFTHGGASTDLAACLEELPSCSSITLVQKLGMFKEKSKCLKLFQRMLLPLEATERYQDRVHGSSDDRTMYGNVHYRNDILSSVLRSIARDTMFIHEFVLETEYEDLYILEDLAPPLLPHEISTAAFANIRTFELQVLDPGSYENDEEILVQLLAGMKHLTHFALIANSGSDRTNSSDLLDALSIPHLKSFRLVGMSFCASHFLDFMRKHADLLKEVYMNDVCLEDGSISFLKNIFLTMASEFKLDRVGLGAFEVIGGRSAIEIKWDGFKDYSLTILEGDSVGPGLAEIVRTMTSAPDLE